VGEQEIFSQEDQKIRRASKDQKLGVRADAGETVLSRRRGPLRAKGAANSNNSCLLTF
jgi:hypothetical protein